MALEILRLKRRDTKMCVVSLEGKKEEMLENWPRLQQFEKNLVFLDKKPGYSLSTFLKLRSLFRKFQPNAVHTHHIGPLLYAGISARLADIPVLVHTEHDAWHLENTKRRLLENIVVKLTRPIFVADSKTVKSSVQQFLPKVKPLVILNGVDTEKYAPGDKLYPRTNLNLPLNKIIVGCAGRLEIEKGQATLIRSIARLPEQYHLALAGSGAQLDNLIELTRRLNIENRVSFLGHVDDMLSFYRSLDIFCLSSLNEGLPLAPLEAQACNIPSVLTEVGGTREALCPETGQLVRAGSPLELAHAIRKVDTNASQRSSREFVVQNACAKKMANEYFNLCRAV